MTYDFDKVIDRHDTNCVKHDEMPNRDTIALWVADMDFETAPVVQRALLKRMEHGCFGYTFVPETFYQATINWFAKRHGWSGIKREWFIYTSGVVPALSAIIKAMTNPGDGVLLQTPVYNCFFSSVRNNGCRIVENPLVYQNNTYTVDWEDFEAKCKEVKVFVLCNPHNPAGRVWTRSELIRMGEICKRNNVFVISDEIHCEFVNPHITDNRYTPFMSVSDTECAVCVSPSKAFNIAGLQIANIIAKNDEVRSRIDRAININEVCDVNPFGVIALQAAYTDEGREWLCQLNEYIYANYEYCKDYIEREMPQLKVTKLEGTYLMWVNVSALGSGDEVAEQWLRDANVYVNKGSMYGEDSGKQFVRINLATQRAKLKEGLERIKAKCL